MPLDDEDWFEQFLKRLAESRIASQSELVGCSPGEIQSLEEKYQVTLPRTYRWYLETMGHKSGRLFTWDHLAVSYDAALVLKEGYLRSVSEEAAASESDDDSFENDEILNDEVIGGVELPGNALIILGRLGDQFHYVRCNGDDSPVFYFNTDDNEVMEVFPTVKSWLESMASGSESAIASGYFKQYPGGTTP